MVQKYCGVVFYIFGCLVVILFVSLLPDFPSFLYSILPCANDTNIPCTTDNKFENISYYVLRMFLSVFEFYSFALVCGLMGASTFIFGLVYRIVSNSIEGIRWFVLQQVSRNPVEVDIGRDEKMKKLSIAYNSLQILCDLLGSTFSGSLLVQEATILLTITYVLFVALTFTSGSLILSLFFGYISIVLCFVITFQFFPMVKLFLGSVKVLPFLRAQSVGRKFDKKQVMSFRTLKVRPAQVHTVTLNTFCDYCAFTVSFVILLISLEPKA